MNKESKDGVNSNTTQIYFLLQVVRHTVFIICILFIWYIWIWQWLFIALMTVIFYHKELLIYLRKYKSQLILAALTYITTINMRKAISLLATLFCEGIEPPEVLEPTIWTCSIQLPGIEDLASDWSDFLYWNGILFWTPLIFYIMLSLICVKYFMRRFHSTSNGDAKGLYITLISMSGICTFTFLMFIIF